MLEMFSAAVQSVVLQVGISWDSVFDIFTKHLPDMYKSFAKWGLKSVIDHFFEGPEDLFRVILRTPSPEMRNGGVLFGNPEQAIWNHLKTLYWSKFLPVGYLVLFLSVMVSNFGKAWGVGNSKDNQRKAGLLVGLFLVPGGWYLAIAYLKLMNLFALSVVPTPSRLQAHSIDAMSTLLSGDIMLASMLGGVAIVAYLLAVIVHMIRLFAIWVLVPTLPLVMGFDLGEFPVLGDFSRRAYSAFIVLGAVPIPIAIGTRIMISFQEMADKGGDVVFAGIADTMFVLVVPTFAALVPIYVFSQAADYATIRGVSAALSIISTPASLAASGWKAAGKKGLSRIFGSNADDEDADDDGGDDDGGEPGDSGPRPSSGDSGRGDGNGRSGLPKRRPSGARPTTRGGPESHPSPDGDGANWTPGTREISASAKSDTQPPALPGLHDADPAGTTSEVTAGRGGTVGDFGFADTARADYVAGGEARSNVDYVSDGRMVDPEVSFATHADREFARSQVIATGAASPYSRTQPTSSNRPALPPSNREGATGDGGPGGDGEGHIQTTGDDETPDVVDDAAARARRRRGRHGATTDRTRKQHERRRRRQASLRDQYYGDDS